MKTAKLLPVLAAALLASQAAWAQSQKKKTDPKAPTLQEALTWLQKLPETKGQKVDFTKLTVDDLKKMTTLAIGGHVKADPKAPHLVVNPEDFKYLMALPALEELNLTECGGTTDPAMKHIGKIATLKKLEMGDGELTDAGLKDLVNLKNLIHLGLGWATKVTDAGLVEVVKMSGLQTLDVRGTKVSPQGVAAMAAKLPNCKVTSK